MANEFVYIPDCKINIARHLLQDEPRIKAAVKSAGLSLDRDLNVNDGILGGFTPKKAKSLLDHLGTRLMTQKQRESAIKYAKTNDNDLYEDITDVSTFELFQDAKGNPLVYLCGNVSPLSEFKVCENFSDYSGLDCLTWLGLREIREK